MAHFHYVLSLGAVFCIFAGVYYWFRQDDGLQYPEWIGKIHFWMMFIGANVTFLPAALPGPPGMPRRYRLPRAVRALELRLLRVGAFLRAGVFLFFFWIIFYPSCATSQRGTEPAWGEGATRRSSGPCRHRRPFHQFETTAADPRRTHH